MEKQVWIVEAFCDCIDSVWDSEELANARRVKLDKVNGEGSGTIQPYTVNKPGNFD